MDLSPSSPSLPAAKLLRMAQHHCTEQPKNLLFEAGFCPSAQEPFWWNGEEKIEKSPPPHTLMGPTALHSRRENLQGATPRLQRAFIRQGMLSAPINSAAEKYLTGLGHCSVFWAAWVLWAGAGSSGMQGHSAVRVWSGPLSSCHDLQDHPTQ